ncbi:MAG: hypothetical protein PHT83_02760 [Bacilli bacterium]|nr:hypothetical protein [Bacilli bacterium]
MFNGNNYTDEWVKEAKSRGLLNLSCTVEALPEYIKEKNIVLFEKHSVLKSKEVHSRCEILLENYCKVVRIEALTMIEIIKKSIIPALVNYQKDLLGIVSSKKELNPDLNSDLEFGVLSKISKLSYSLNKSLEELESSVLEVKSLENVFTASKFYRESVFMNILKTRIIIDELETIVSKNYWPFPTYGEILYSAN